MNRLVARARRARRPSPWLTWALTRAFGIAGVYGLFFYGLRSVFGVDGDILMYGSWAWLLQHGHLPYSSFPMVYPPGVLPFMLIPAIRGPVYQAEFLGLAVLADAYVFHRLRAAGLRGGAWLWVVGGLLVGPIFWARLDVFVAVAVVVAVLEFGRRRPERAAFWIGCAAALKVWPVLLLVPIVLAVAGRRRVRALAWGLAAPVALTVPVVAWGGLPGLWEAMRVQTGRGVEVESIFALPVELGRALNVWTISPSETLSWEFDGHVGSVLGGIATLVMAVGIVAWLGMVVVRRGMTPFPLAPVALLLTAVVVATAKALSPQYSLWVLAGAVVACDRAQARRRLVVCTSAFLLSTQLVFPLTFGGLLMADWPATLVAVAHAGSVLALLLAAGACLPAPPAASVVPVPGRASPSITPLPAAVVS